MLLAVCQDIYLECWIERHDDDFDDRVRNEELVSRLATLQTLFYGNTQEPHVDRAWRNWRKYYPFFPKAGLSNVPSE